MTTRINLLPWREELRKKRERDFYVMLAGAAALGAAVWLLGHTYLAGEIDYQEGRNRYLENEIEQLDRKIVEIRELEKTKKQLIARMNVIQELQQGRPQIVHLFHQFVTTLPEGLYLSQISEQGDQLQIKGVAESNSRVSTYMENLDESDWLTDPDLSVIEVKEDAGIRISSFDLQVKETAPKQRTDEEEDS